MDHDSIDAVPRYLDEWDDLIGPLPTLSVQNKERSHKPDVVVVFLHGYGSNTRRTKKIAETVLNYCFLPPTSYFLQDRSTPVPTVRFLIPQAPQPVADGVFGWWSLPKIGLSFSGLLSGTHQLEQYDPGDELEDVRQLLNDYLAAVDAAHPDCLLVLGGFSQGSLLTLDLNLTGSYYRKPDMLILMSSTLIEKQLWRQRIEECTLDETPLFDCYIVQTHGVKDRILSYSEAKKLFVVLATNNASRTQFFSFDGGHNMSLKARQHVAASLDQFVYSTLYNTCSKE